MSAVREGLLGCHVPEVSQLLNSIFAFYNQVKARYCSNQHICLTNPTRKFPLIDKELKNRGFDGFGIFRDKFSLLQSDLITA